MTYASYMWVEFKLHCLLTLVLAYLQVKHFAESQLTVHKELNLINQSVTHGLTVGRELFCMHCDCEQCQSWCWHINTFKKYGSQTCSINSHTGMVGTRWGLKCSAAGTLSPQRMFPLWWLPQVSNIRSWCTASPFTEWGGKGISLNKPCE